MRICRTASAVTGTGFLHPIQQGHDFRAPNGIDLAMAKHWQNGLGQVLFAPLAVFNLPPSRLVYSATDGGERVRLSVYGF